MKCSDYSKLLECMRKWENIGRALICGRILWKKLQESDMRDISFCEIDEDAAISEAERMFILLRGELHSIAISEWAMQRFSHTVNTFDDAAEKNGCNFSINNNSS